MYTTNGNTESSILPADPTASMNTHPHHNTNLVALDDPSQSLNDSDLYIPQMFAV